MGQVMSILVEYKNVDGWHVFSSREMAGLYIASQQAEVAFNDVSTAIEKLMKLNSGISCVVTPTLSYSDFIKSVREEQEKSGQKKRAEKVAQPIALGSRRYTVCAVSEARAAA